MAELIGRNDDLNTGREKLNKAIKASERAEQKSDQAVNTSNEAKSQSQLAENKADNVQEQFNQVVIEGDSSVEAAQARVDSEGNAYSTLKERLDDKETEFSSQLAETENNLHTREINVLFPPPPLVGAKGDGITDDTATINACINFLGGKGGKVKFPVGSYRFTSKIVVPNGVTLEGSGQRESYSGNTDNRPTQLLKDGNFEGIELGATSVLLNMCVDGADGNEGTGVRLMNNRARLENVTVSKMGGDGIAIGHPDIEGNRNSWVLRNVSTTNNYGYGFVLDDYNPGYGPDVNAGYAERANAYGNGKDGWYLGSSAVCTFLQCYSESNQGNGWTVNQGAQRHTFLNCGSEQNAGEQFIFTTGTSNNLLFGAVAFDPVDNGNNTIIRSTGGAKQVLDISNFIRVGKTTPITYPLDVGFQIIGTNPGIQFHDTDSAETEKTLDILYNAGKLTFRTLDDDGKNPQNIITVDRNKKNLESVKFEGKVIASGGLGVGNAVTVNQPTPTNVWRKVQVFDASGNPIGYVPVYQDI